MRLLLSPPMKLLTAPQTVLSIYITPFLPLTHLAYLHATKQELFPSSTPSDHWLQNFTSEVRAKNLFAFQH